VTTGACHQSRVSLELDSGVITGNSRRVTGTKQFFAQIRRIVTLERINMDALGYRHLKAIWVIANYFEIVRVTAE
jgi:hypothetical protein